MGLALAEHLLLLGTVQEQKGQSFLTHHCHAAGGGISYTHVSSQMSWGHSGRTKRSGGVVRSDGSTTAQPQTGSGTSCAARERGQGSANAWALWDRYSLAGWDASGWMWMFVMSLLERVTPALLQSPQKDMVSFRLCSSPPELDVPDELYLKTIFSLHCLEKKLKVLNYQQLILELLTKKGEVGESPWMILQSTCLKIFF